MASRALSTDGPSNHVRFSPREAMLSPWRAETGRMTCASTPIPARNCPVLCRDGVEHLLRVVDEIHLVDDHDDLTHADQAKQVPVTACLLLHTLGGIDDDERGVGTRRTGHHVLDELLVAGSVDDDVLALRRPEPDLARIDGDVLVALGLQRVHQIGELERNASALCDGDELFVFAFGKRAGVVKQTADERRFAVVDVSHDDKSELVPRVRHHM